MKLFLFNCMDPVRFISDESSPLSSHGVMAVTQHNGSYQRLSIVTSSVNYPTFPLPKYMTASLSFSVHSLISNIQTSTGVSSPFLLSSFYFLHKQMKRFISSRILRSASNKPLNIRPLTVVFHTNRPHRTQFSTSKMSFSNTDTGNKPADPYKAANKDETSIKEKVEDLSEFISASKFGMMTTRDGSSGALVSRCMALAAKVRMSSLF